MCIQKHSIFALADLRGNLVDFYVELQTGAHIRPVSKKLVRDLFHDRAQILRDRVSKIKFQAALNTDHYRYLANKRTD